MSNIHSFTIHIEPNGNVYLVDSLGIHYPLCTQQQYLYNHGIFAVVQGQTVEAQTLQNAGKKQYGYTYIHSYVA